MSTKEYLHLGISKQFGGQPSVHFIRGMLCEDLTYRPMCVYTRMFYKLNVHEEGATPGFEQVFTPCKLLASLWENINLK